MCGGNDVTSEEGENDVDQNKYGKKREHNKSFKGPITDGRGCTDILCCLLFVAVILGEAAVAYFAFREGDPKILLAPTDSAGNLCGKDPLVMDKPYLVFFDIFQCARMGPAVAVKGCPTPQVCVKNCPTEMFAYQQLLIAGQDTEENRKLKLVCKNNTNYTMTTQVLIDQQMCATYTIKSRSLLGRCIPSFLFEATKLAETIKNSAGQELKNSDNTTMTYQLVRDGSKYLALMMSAQEVGTNVFNDIITAWYMILIGCGIGFVLAFVWCLLVRCVASYIIWSSLLAFFVAFAGGASYCFYQYLYNKSTQEKFEFTTNLSSYLAMRDTWLVLGCVAAVLTLIILLIIICLRDRIMLAVAIIGQASKAVAAITTTLIFPLIPWIIEIACIAFWVVTATYLAATGKKQFVQTNLTSLDPSAQTEIQTEACSLENVTISMDSSKMLCQFAMYAGNDWAQYLQGYNLFICLWLLAFVIGFGQIVLAGTFASWYWAWEKPKDIPAFPVASALWRSIRYHIGTVAFGSFLIAVVWLMRIILEYIEQKTKASQNVLSRILFCCCRCCLWCLEKCLKFLTKNAYIVTAIYGFNFCHAAVDVFWLIFRNIARVATINCVTTFVLFIGKLLVTGLTCTLTFFFFDGTIGEYFPELKALTPSLNYFFVPVIVVGVATYVVATIFFNVYDFAVDTLFICVMEDLERNDGSAEKPYFMSKDLMKLMDVKNKFEGGDPSKRDGCCLCGC